MSDLRPRESEPLFSFQVSKRSGWLFLVVVIGALLFAIYAVRQTNDVADRTTEVAPIKPTESRLEPKSIEPPSARPINAQKVTVNHTETATPVPIVQEVQRSSVVEYRGPVIESPQSELVASTVMHTTGLVVHQREPGILSGAGATFPRAIYLRWFSEYRKLHPELEFKYEAIGNGGGIRQVLAGAIDFGASDLPLTDEQLAASEIGVLHVPTVLGALVPIYNLPNVGELRFTPEALAGIYLGKIESWNDPAIQKVNPQILLPNIPIAVVHRSDGCSTTFVFTDYLAKVSREWQDTAGKGTSVRWPVGVGAKGNEGVEGMVGHLEGAIGYVDFIYAADAGLHFGSVRNAAGRFVKASLQSITESAAQSPMPADFRVSITNGSGGGAYPISSYTWLLVPEDVNGAAGTPDLRSFLLWMLRDGQRLTSDLNYAPLPPGVAARISQAIRSRDAAAH